MKLRKLLFLAIANLFVSSVAMASSPSDYFQTGISGNSKDKNTWQSSTSLTGPWVASTLVPDQNSPGIFIRGGNTLTIDSTFNAKALTIDAGGVLIHPSGISLTIYDGAATYDFVINGQYQLNGTAPTFIGAAQFSVASTAQVIATDDIGGQSDNFAFDTHGYWNSGTFIWRNIYAFQTSGITYFPNSSATDKPQFRIEANVGNVGSNSSTTINGIFDVAYGYSITWQNSGTKIFRDGFSGQGTILQASNCGAFQTTSATATIDSTISITLQQTTGDAMEIPVGAVVAISGSPTITVGTSTYPRTTLFIGGKLHHNGAVPIDISNGVLSMNGANVPNKAVLDGTGTFTGSSTASVLITKFATATLRMTPGGTNNYLHTLTVATQATVTLADSLNMTAGTDYGTVTVTNNGVINSNGYLTFKSDANGTARVGTSSGIINDTVTVERYVPSQHKAWRLLSRGPFKDSAQSINSAWQGGYTNATGNCALNGGTPGYDAILFNGGARWPGYDSVRAGSTNIKTFTNGGNSFLTPSSTNAVPLARYQGYFVFLYGDRQICPVFPVTSTSTTLRTRGILNVGTTTVTLSGLTIGGYYMVGNPYASDIDATNVVARSTGIANLVEIWDPNGTGLYGYGEYLTASGSVIIPTGGTTDFPDAASVRIIKNGQAFIIQATDTTATITFMEADKTTSTSSGVFTATAASMNISLAAGTTTTAQGYASTPTVHPEMGDPIERSASDVSASVNAPFTSTAVAPIDGVAIRLNNDSNIVKLPNTSNANYLFLQEGGRRFAIQSKALPAGSSDTFNLELNGLSAKGYQLVFDHQQHFFGKTAMLIDRYLNTDTTITEGFNYQFAVTSDTSSYKHRFMIVVNAPLTGERKPSKVFFKRWGIFPNPVHDVLNINPVPTSVFNIMNNKPEPAIITDITGRIVVKIPDLTTAGKKIDVSTWSNGIYIVKIGINANTETYKIVKF